MTVSLFTFVDLYRRQLDAAEHLLAKGLEHAAANGVDEAELLDWRLIADMNPLRFQLMVVINFACRWPARVAGLPVPDEIDDRRDAAGFVAAIGEARRFLAGLTPAHFADRDAVPITFAIGPGMEPTLPADQWLTVFATTNLYFHLSTAYGILRAHGVPLGKVDLFAAGL